MINVNNTPSCMSMLLLGSISIMVLGNIFITGYLINHSCGSRMYLQWCWHSIDNVRINIQSHISLTTTGPYTINALWWFWNKIKWQTHLELNENLSRKWTLFLFYFDISWVNGRFNEISKSGRIRIWHQNYSSPNFWSPWHISRICQKCNLSSLYIFYIQLFGKKKYLLILTQWTFCRFSWKIQKKSCACIFDDYENQVKHTIIPK